MLTKHFIKYHQIYDQLVLRKFKRACTLLKPRSFYLKMSLLHSLSFFHMSYWYYRIFYKVLFHPSTKVDFLNSKLYRCTRYYYYSRKMIAKKISIRGRYYYHRFDRYKKIEITETYFRRHGWEKRQRLCTRGQFIMETISTNKVLLTSPQACKHFIALNSTTTLPLHLILSITYLCGSKKQNSLSNGTLKLFLTYQTCINKQYILNMMRFLNLFFITFYQSLRHMKLDEPKVPSWVDHKRRGYRLNPLDAQSVYLHYYNEYVYGKHTQFGFKRGLVYNPYNLFRFYTSPYNIITHLLRLEDSFILDYVGVTPWVRGDFIYYLHDALKWYIPNFWFMYYVGALTNPYNFWGNDSPYEHSVSIFLQRWYLPYRVVVGTPERTVFFYRQGLLE